MKKSIFIFATIIFLFSFSVSFSQWVQCGGPLGGGIYGISKSNGNKLWAATQNGIYSSIDNGNSWQPNQPSIKGCHNVLAHGDSIMIIFDVFVKPIFFGNDSYNTYSSFSSNNGVSWSTPSLITGATTPNYGTLYKTGNKYLLTEPINQLQFESQNFGATWNPAVNAISNTYLGYNPVYVNNSVFHLESSYNILNPMTYQCVSFNAKNTWAIIDSNWNKNKHIIFVMDSSIFYFNDTLNAKILRSTNLGINYDTILNAPLGYPKFYGIYNNHDTIYVVFSDTAVNQPQLKTFRSKNKGNTWQAMGNYFSKNYISKFEMISSNELIYGSMMKYSEVTDTSMPFINDIKSQLIWKIKSNGTSLFAMSNYQIFRSDDDGMTWADAGPKYFNYGFSDFDVSNDTLVAVDHGDSLHFSINNGNIWNTSYIPFNHNLEVKLSNGRVFMDSVGSPNSFNKYSLDLGNTWYNLLYQGGLSNQYHSFCEVGDTLYDFMHDGTNYNRYKFNSLTNQFDLSGITNLSTTAINIGIIHYHHGVWFSYGNSCTLPFSSDGLNWNSSNFSSIAPSLFWNPYYSRPVYANGIYYAVYDDTNFIYSSNNGVSWQLFPGGSNFTFLNYLNSYDKPELIAHKGILYSPTFQSSIWRRSDTIRTFSGNIYYDANNNSIKDLGEINLENKLAFTPNSFANSNVNGIYNLLSDQVGDSLKITLPSPSFTSNPSYRITNSSMLSGNDFGLYASPTLSDMKIDIANTAAFNPGFNTHLITTVSNNGTLSQTSTMSIELDSSLTFLSATPAPTSISGSIYTWNIASLSFSQQTIIDMLVKTNTATTIGNIIHCEANIMSAVSDLYPINNTATFNEIVVGSFDPNDKTCVQGDQLTTKQLDSNKALDFIIRFQNTGTLATSFIRIEDTLSSFLDWSTFQVVSSSHPMTYTLEGNGVVKFYFNPISLPPQSVNEAESHGYVKYQIHPKRNLAIGNVIRNTAYIYFDFNAPIVTNTTATTIVINAVALTDGAPINYNEYQNSILIYPNPSTGNFIIDMSTVKEYNSCSLMLFDQYGRKVKQVLLSETINKISTDIQIMGVYYGKVINNKGELISTFKIQIHK